MSNRNTSERADTPAEDVAPEPERTPAEDVNDGARSVEALRAQISQLRTENQRLRREYAAAQQTRYRRTAIGLYLVGGLSIGAALLFPDTRAVLFALGATGLFAGLLTYYLTPERFVAARVSDRLAAAHATTLDALISDLGLQSTHVYVPLDDAGVQPSDVLLFIPRAAQYELPETLTPGIAVPDSRHARGLVVVPSGGLLLHEFERASTDPLSETPSLLATQLADGITDQFELARTADAEIAPLTSTESASTSPAEQDAATDVAADADTSDAGRLTIHVEDPVIDATPADNPIASFVAAGAATALDTPVTVAESSSPEESAYRVTIEWDTTA